MINLLKDSDKSVRSQAVRALAAVAGPTDAVVGALASRVEDDAAEVRIAAIQELAQMGPAAKDAVQCMSLLPGSHAGPGKRVSPDLPNADSRFTVRQP